MKKRIALAVLWTAAGIGIAGVVAAQSGTRNYSGQSRGSGQGNAAQANRGARPRAQLPFEERFWDFLQTAQYRNWAPLPGHTVDTYAGQSPHGARLRLYANRTAVGGDADYPFGSVIVKENFDETGQNLMAVTVMYRTQGFAPESDDWYWVKYEPNGAVARKNDRPLAGVVKGCIDCHQGAAGNDYVFTNDP